MNKCKYCLNRIRKSIVKSYFSTKTTTVFGVSKWTIALSSARFTCAMMHNICKN
ncbi:hypothetical protein BBSC_2447 [Bifidobacterium scardovii JCM 12489 = DSM 13734]|nr:hypothetical protein BBSC_2447 [Bifidobacterium scardovii JCM 12489 = DSM 13734]